MQFVELKRKGNIVVTLRPFSDNLWYFQVTEEVKEQYGDWYQCRVLKRTWPIYHLNWLNKVLKGDKYRAFFNKRAERLCNKYHKQARENEHGIQ